MGVNLDAATTLSHCAPILVPLSTSPPSPNLMEHPCVPLAASPAPWGDLDPISPHPCGPSTGGSHETLPYKG